ncbi:Calx-beta domain-containing protein [Prosthecobacter debontii]|uniref:Calx-beta domain-containing protein n=1 Tax=Prosthecobacter debontii TaxID=48467 RepID=A0A1T4YBZ1_9BACT|nr:Calx-beta domain-containing protein [Prosthecobacter debontii]SKA99357.1 Calx-beta domain-containing protein [Prosthecobacter debontii]
MKHPPLRALALLALLAPLAAHAAAPVNDKFDKARVLTTTSPVFLNQTGVGSTPDALDPFIGGSKLARSVWYRYDAVFTTDFNRIIIDDKPGVRAAVFEMTDADGNAGTLKFLAETNNVLPNDIETLVFSTVAGRRYCVCVEANGLFDITLQSTPRPNDYFGDAIGLPGDQGTVTGNNDGATNVNDSPATLADDTPGSGVWYVWTPGFNGQAVVDTNFSERTPNNSLDTVVAVFTGNTLQTLVPVASDDDDGYQNNSRVVFNANAGTPYRIWVGGFGGQAGTFFLSYYPEGNPGVFEIASVPNSVGENQGTTAFHVRRFRAGLVAANVTISTANGSATAGSDYTAINTVLNFPNPVNDQNGWQQTVNLTIVPDINFTELPAETFNLVLSAPSPGASVGGSSPAGVAIRSGEPTDAAGFLVENLQVREDAGGINIPLVRAAAGGYVRMQVLALVSTSAPGAKPELDYNFAPVTVDLVPGQTQASVQLQILNDGLSEGEETITLFVNAETPDLQTTGYTVLTVTIEDDDLVVPQAGRLTTFMDAGGTGITGGLDIKITATGMVSGKLVMARGSLPFTGKLVDGRLTVRLGPVTGPVRTLTIELLNAADQTYRVTLSDGELGSTVTEIVRLTNYTALNPCPVAGYFTFADVVGGGDVPQLVTATIKVTAAGDAKLTGKLFDGTAVLASGGVGEGNNARMGASLYKGLGRALCEANLPTASQDINSGSFKLLRPGRSNQSVELPALDVSSSSRVAKWVPPAAGQRALTIWNPAGAGNADLTGGGFAVLTTKALTVSTANKVVVTVNPPENLKITLNAKTGLFTGTVIPTGVTKPQKIFGVMLQGGGDSFGNGFFLNGMLPGKIRLRGP